MQLPFGRRRVRHPAQLTAMNVTGQPALATTAITNQRLAKHQHSIRLAMFFAGLLLLALIVPTSPVRLALGYGGGSALGAPTCGRPAPVFATLLQGIAYTLPTHAQLMQLPTPQQRKILTASDATYDPKNDQLCAGSALALELRYVNPQPAVGGSTNYNPSYGLNSMLSGFWGPFTQWLRDSLQTIIDGATSFGFMFVTPKALTYGHAVVQNLEQWMLLVMDGVLALFLVVGGYSYMFGGYQRFQDFAPRLVMAAIGAHFSLFILGQFIEVCNTLCTGILGVLASAGIGNLSLPLGVLNWATAPEYLILVYLIEMACAVLLIGQMLLRIALLDFLLVTAPIGWLLCFGLGDSLPGMRIWGQLWVQAFVATLIAQPLQVLCLGLGSALIASFGHATITPISILVGIAALFLAGRIPDMLLTNVMRAMGSRTANQFGHQILDVAQTGVEMAAIWMA